MCIFFQFGHLSVKSCIVSKLAECRGISSSCRRMSRWSRTVVVIWSKKIYKPNHSTHMFTPCQVDMAICLLPMLIFMAEAMLISFRAATAKHLWHTANSQLISRWGRWKVIGGPWTRRKSLAITARRVQLDTVERWPSAALFIRDCMAVSQVGLLVYIYVSFITCKWCVFSSVTCIILAMI